MRIENNVIVEFNAFEDLKNNTLTIPANVVDIDILAAEGNWLSLNECKNIIVEKGNSIFYVKDGCLINSKTKTLICGLDNTIIPNDGSVEKIGHYAFNMRTMSKIVIPESVKEIGYMAFACLNCNEISDKKVEIFIPSTVIKIYPRAFALNANTNICVDNLNPNYYTNNGLLIERQTNIHIAEFGTNKTVLEMIKEEFKISEDEK